METEADLIHKYEHILGTMRSQIRSLKSKVTAADEPRKVPRRRASPSPVTTMQDFALVEFKEELVRKEFELEECLLELEEVKSELRKQTSKRIPPLNLPNTQSDEASPRGVQPALSWEDEAQMREDLTHSKDDPEFAPELDPSAPDVDLLRQKVTVVERENRLLREKVDLCDNEIKSLLSRSTKQEVLAKMQSELRTTDLQDRGRTEERGRRSKEAAKKASAPQSRQRSVEEYERDVQTARVELAEKDRLLAASNLRASQLTDELRCSRPGLNNLWREVKEELNRDIGSPRTNLMQRKIETLQGSFNSSALNAAAISSMLSEKEEALSEMTRRYNALAEQYRSVVKTQSPVTPKQCMHSPETSELAMILSEKEIALADLNKRFTNLSDQHKALMQIQNEQKMVESKEKELGNLKQQISEKDGAIEDLRRKVKELMEQFEVLQKVKVREAAAEDSQAGSPRKPPLTVETKPMTPGSGMVKVNSKGELKPLANAMKEGIRKMGAVDPRSPLTKKIGAVMRGKPGDGRTPR